MPELLVDNAPIVIGASGMEEITQNIRMIVLTMTGSVPLHRNFAHVPGYLDAPSPLEAARLIARLTNAIETWEPRVKVKSIRLTESSVQDSMLGKLVPVIEFILKEDA